MQEKMKTLDKELEEINSKISKKNEKLKKFKKKEARDKV